MMLEVLIFPLKGKKKVHMDFFLSPFVAYFKVNSDTFHSFSYSFVHTYLHTHHSKS